MAAEALASTILEQLASLNHKYDTKSPAVLDDLKTKFTNIQLLLQDVETRKEEDEKVRVWLDKHKKTSYDIEDVLDELNTRIRKPGDANKFKPSKKVCTPCTRDIFDKIENLSRTLDVIDKEKDEHKFRQTEDIKQTNDYVDLPEVNICGRNKDKDKLLSLLLTNSRQGPIFPIISVVGMRGSGKTTITQQAFNNEDVSNHFEKKVWVRVSGLFDEISIAKEILKHLEDMTQDLDRLETLFESIRQYFQGFKFLLVLDDVCITGPKIWKEMRNLLKYNCQGSKILITIREQDNVKMVGNTSLISLGQLSGDESWKLFCNVAFDERNSDDEIKNIGKQIVSKCNGVPLNLRLLGGLLRLKTGVKEWETILNSKFWELEVEKWVFTEEWNKILNSNFWDLKVAKAFFSSLFLSFYDLPITLRKCLLCCAIFPKDYKLEKDTLIKLWMAQGYLKIDGREDLEKVGVECFQNLAVRSFFHDFQINEHNNKTVSFKMPDLIHDFVQSLAKDECCMIEVDGLKEVSNKKIRHMKIIEKSNPTSGFEKGKLLSLVKCGINSKVGGDLSKLFEQFTSLKTLDLSGCLFEDLSGGIKNLIHLRYLNLSGNKVIKELPEALWGLYSLQTLNISNCDKLKDLQPGIGKLTNLLHLINYGTPLSYVPKEFTQLTCLRTLNKFAVSDEKDDIKACKLEALQESKHLEGFLIITGLGNVSNVNELYDAKLKEKGSLVGLGLRFNGLTHVDDEVLIRGLEPPPNLEELMVQYYIGQSMSLKQLMPPIKLKVLKLSFCLEFVHLPAIGMLPHLESLYIANMKNVKQVGKEFSVVDKEVSGKEIDSAISGVDKEFAGKETDGASASNSTGTDTGTFFPKLRTLKFQSMDEWRIWDMDEDITIMPGLESLTIRHCLKLEALPVKILGTLKKLRMYNCSRLKELYNKKTGTEWSKISEIPNIEIDGEQQKDSK